TMYIHIFILFFFYCYRAHLYLHSFPTRRSSDLRRRVLHFNVTSHPTSEWTAQQIAEAFPWDSAPGYLLHDRDAIYGDSFRERNRTDERTSELQSLAYLVCRLLLEKKKKKKTNIR